MARVQQVEGAVDVDDARVGRRGAPIAELHDAARGGHEARDERVLRGRPLRGVQTLCNCTMRREVRMEREIRVCCVAGPCAASKPSVQVHTHAQQSLLREQ